MLNFRSPYLTSQRVAHGWTRPWWIVTTWCCCLIVVLPAALIVLGVQYDWFDHPNLLYTIHDAVYLPLKGWLILKPWPYSLIPLGYVMGIAAALALPLLVGRSPLKPGYLWCVRLVLIVLSRLSHENVEHFLRIWMRYFGAHHTAWPLVADKVRADVRKRLDQDRGRRTWWLAELVRWTALTIQLRRIAATRVDHDESLLSDFFISIQRLRAWISGEVSGADLRDELKQVLGHLRQRLSPSPTVISEPLELSRKDRICNARAWLEAVVRILIVATQQQPLDTANCTALVKGTWWDIISRSGGALRDRVTLTWNLILQQPTVAEQCEWLLRDVGSCVTEEMQLAQGWSKRNSFADDVLDAAGLDFESVARDLTRLLPLLLQLAKSADDQEDQCSETALHDVSCPLLVDRMPPALRQNVRQIKASTIRRRKLVEHTLQEMESRPPFHEFARVSAGEQINLEPDPDISAMCLELGLVPGILSGEAGPLQALIEAIDAFHLLWSLNQPVTPLLDSTENCSPEVPLIWQHLATALTGEPRPEIRNYCRKLQEKLCVTSAEAVLNSVLCETSIVGSHDLDIMRERAGLTDRVSLFN